MKETLSFNKLICGSNSYNDARLYFLTEYDRENPVTKDMGYTEWYRYLESKRKDFTKLTNDALIGKGGDSNYF